MYIIVFKKIIFKAVLIFYNFNAVLSLVTIYFLKWVSQQQCNDDCMTAIDNIKQCQNLALFP